MAIDRPVAHALDQSKNQKNDNDEKD
jgi:hypothetical protein